MMEGLNIEKLAAEESRAATMGRILQRVTAWLKHLVGIHNSSCRQAGAWSMQPHKKIRGPHCSVTKLPLLLPKNRDR